MARGGRGGGRGGSRGKGVGFAQSGGRATTFQGTSGGGAFGSASGGSRGTKSRGKTTLANGTTATVRSPGGDNTTVHGGLSGASVGPNVAAQRGKRGPAYIKPSLRKGAQRGRGGSTQ